MAAQNMPGYRLIGSRFAAPTGLGIRGSAPSAQRPVSGPLLPSRASSRGAALTRPPAQPQGPARPRRRLCGDTHRTAPTEGRWLPLLAPRPCSPRSGAACVSTAPPADPAVPRSRPLPDSSATALALRIPARRSSGRPGTAWTLATRCAPATAPPPPCSLATSPAAAWASRRLERPSRQRRGPAVKGPPAALHLLPRPRPAAALRLPPQPAPRTRTTPS